MAPPKPAHGAACRFELKVARAQFQWSTRRTLLPPTHSLSLWLQLDISPRALSGGWRPTAGSSPCDAAALTTTVLMLRYDCRRCHATPRTPQLPGCHDPSPCSRQPSTSPAFFLFRLSRRHLTGQHSWTSNDPRPWHRGYAGDEAEAPPRGRAPRVPQLRPAVLQV